MQQKDLKENFEFVEKNKEKLLEEYFNKYLLVYQKEVADTFDTYEKAAGEGVQKFGIDEEGKYGQTRNILYKPEVTISL